MEEIYFINQNGEKVYIENIMSHIGIANAIIESDSELKREFDESKVQNPIQFLIADKGYIAVSNIPYYKKVTFDSKTISDIQRKKLIYYNEEGYGMTDFELERRMLERGEK